MREPPLDWAAVEAHRTRKGAAAQLFFPRSPSNADVKPLSALGIIRIIFWAFRGSVAGGFGVAGESSRDEAALGGVHPWRLNSFDVDSSGSGNQWQGTANTSASGP